VKVENEEKIGKRSIEGRKEEMLSAGRMQSPTSRRDVERRAHAITNIKERC